jgi:hypothetical protein
VGDDRARGCAGGACDERHDFDCAAHFVRDAPRRRAVVQRRLELAVQLELAEQLELS